MKFQLKLDTHKRIKYAYYQLHNSNNWNKKNQKIRVSITFHNNMHNILKSNDTFLAQIFCKLSEEEISLRKVTQKKNKPYKVFFW